MERVILVVPSFFSVSITEGLGEELGVGLGSAAAGELSGAPAALAMTSQVRRLLLGLYPVSQARDKLLFKVSFQIVNVKFLDWPISQPQALGT